MKNYKGYLFDLDGTLVKSEELKGKALAKTCNLYGGYVKSDIYKNVMGENWETVTGYFFYKGNITPSKNEFNEKFKLIYLELLNNDLTLTDGILNYLRRLSETDSRLGLVSSAAEWMVNNILNRFELSHFFEIIITQENVIKHKPDPEPYILALDKLDLQPDEVLVFEDSEAGLKSAIVAGCKTIAVKHEFNAQNDLTASLKQIYSFRELTA
ncbi:MAG TPA: HAD family phosphatase [Victivallales bacterium]|nr:HAD family phosphatase [Victivallales bacterium]